MQFMELLFQKTFGYFWEIEYKKFKVQVEVCVVLN